MFVWQKAGKEEAAADKLQKAAEEEGGKGEWQHILLGLECHT